MAIKLGHPESIEGFNYLSIQTKRLLSQMTSYSNLTKPDILLHWYNNRIPISNEKYRYCSYCSESTCCQLISWESTRKYILCPLIVTFLYALRYGSASSV